MKLIKPLVLLDLESTGVWVEKDRIIEMAFIKYSPGGKKEIFHRRINPGIKIPPHVTELTGISDEDVKEAPSFKQVAHEAAGFIGSGVDFGGFNIERFDLPLLQREFAEAGIGFSWEDAKIYDAQKIFHLNEKRDLSAAYQFYCSKELIGAHSALADSEAVYEILQEQVARYGEGVEEISSLDKYEYCPRADHYDQDGKFCWWNGKLYPTFGKYRRNTSLDELVKKDASYLQWLLKSDFKEDVKSLIRLALKGEIPVKISK